LSFPAWIVLGLITGFVGSRIINRTGEGKLLDILLGVVGAVLAGWLFNIYGMPGVTGFQVNSLVVSVIGAVGLLVIYHLFFRRAS
jgi:uncharacterized membrane protein YeaQ/YmgE (transglycosylase-associated protein family)